MNEKFEKLLADFRERVENGEFKVINTPLSSEPNKEQLYSLIESYGLEQHYIYDLILAIQSTHHVTRRMNDETGNICYVIGKEVTSKKERRFSIDGGTLYLDDKIIALIEEREPYHDNKYHVEPYIGCDFWCLTLDDAYKNAKGLYVLR